MGSDRTRGDARGSERERGQGQGRRTFCERTNEVRLEATAGPGRASLPRAPATAGASFFLGASSSSKSATDTDCVCVCVCVGVRRRGPRGYTEMHRGVPIAV